MGLPETKRQALIEDMLIGNAIKELIVQYTPVHLSKVIGVSQPTLQKCYRERPKSLNFLQYRTILIFLRYYRLLKRAHRDYTYRYLSYKHDVPHQEIAEIRKVLGLHKCLPFHLKDLRPTLYPPIPTLDDAIEQVTLMSNW